MTFPVTSQTLGAYIKLSREVFEDAPNISNMVNTSLAENLGLELDRVALEGSGTPPEPQGLLGATGVQQVIHNATLTYDAISNAVQLIEVANHTPNAMIYHPRDRGILDRLKDTTNQPLRPPESYQNLTKLPSSQISLITPASPDVGGTAYVGEWSELLIGMRRELHFVVATVASDASDDAFPQYQIWVAAWLRADIQLGRPAAFVTIEELLAS